MDLVPDDEDGIDVVELINFVTVAKVKMIVEGYHSMHEVEREPTMVPGTHVTGSELETTIIFSESRTTGEDDGEEEGGLEESPEEGSEDGSILHGSDTFQKLSGGLSRS
jgi:hypothetical protein